MASETGHDVNIQNFKLIIDRCTEFSTSYQPSNIALSVVNMTTQWTDAQTNHNNYLGKLVDTKIPVDEREDLFETLTSIVTRANNMFGSTAAKTSVKKDVRGYLNKILGRNIKIPRLEGGVPDPKYVSNSQQSFVKKTYNFQQFVLLLKADTNYAPNEPDLTIVSLEGLLDELKTVNLSVEEILGHAINFRILRDHSLYDLETGVIDVSLACKKYVKGVYGAMTLEASSVTSIALRRIMRLKKVASA